MRSTRSAQEILSFSFAEWAAFVDRLRVSPSAVEGEVKVVAAADGVLVGHGDSAVGLVFTDAEWQTFIASVLDGEFDT